MRAEIVVAAGAFSFAPLLQQTASLSFCRWSRRSFQSSPRVGHTLLHSTAARVGPRIDINEDFDGLHQVHSDPDVFVIRNFLDSDACSDLVRRAKSKTLERSPVAYAGWTEDVKDLLELAAKGPVAWLSLVGAWTQVKDDPTASQIDLVVHSLQNYAVLIVVAAALIVAFTKSRADGLQELRTSTSTTLDDLGDGKSSGTARFVRRAAELFGGGADGGGGVTAGTALRKEAALFEAPTVIRYEAGQVLAPHFDANRSAEIEDANRGGQTLATLIVYLNDVAKGGLTRFGRLPATLCDSATRTGEGPDDDDVHLTVRPARGDAILFFPADASGRFDERTEHEGCPAVDEKWIARIWRHTERVPPPFGLAEDALSKL